MRRAATVIARGLAAMAVFALLAGCSSSKPSSSSTSSSSSSSSYPSSRSSGGPASSSSRASSASTSSGAAASSTTATPATQTTAPAPNGASSPELAARGLHDRWAAGDRAGARSFATDDAVAEMFARSGVGQAWTFQACDAASGGAYCNFSYEGGAAQMHVSDMSNVSRGTITGFKVDAIIFTAG